MATKFTWAFDGHVPARLDPAAVARREAREAAERHLLNLLSPWSEAAHSRRKQHAGAEQHWLDTTVAPLADRLNATIANCQGSAEPAQTDEDRHEAGRAAQRVAADLLRELGQSGRGFIRLGGAATAAAIETSRTIRDFLVGQIVAMNNKDAQP
jgi:hypothetical protein